MKMTKKAVVLLSGGQDSTTSLFWAKSWFKEVLALNIEYGQRHSVEIDAARMVSKLAGVELVELSFPTFKEIGGSAMLEGSEEVKEDRGDGLPSTFLPGRNIVFLTIAAGLGVSRDIFDLVIGVSEADYSGYPDCRFDTLRAVELSLCLGVDKRIRIWAPLIEATKKKTVELARILPGCWNALAFTHTCYHGTRPGCGECPACKLRARGFEEAGFPDPLFEAKP